MVIAIVVSSILSGVGTSKVGYYMPFLIGGICIAAVGTGLLTTFHVDTSEGKWIGYQIIYGFGLGACFQAPNMAAQTVLPRNEVSIGASLMLFAQTLFGAVFVSVGQNVLDGQLVDRLAGVVSITTEQMQAAGTTGLFKIVPAQLLDEVLVAFSDSLDVCFEVAVVLACLAILGALVMEWRNVKAQPKTADEEDGTSSDHVTKEDA